jgi:Iap family predicted aminopeptidase
LCLDVGPRPAGSENLQRAIAWARDELARAGHDAVAIEPVQVPGWERGDEAATLRPGGVKLDILGLGGTVSTPGSGVKAKVVSISSWEELEAKAADVKGRIVFFDVKMKIDEASGLPNYGPLVGYRRAGPSRVAKMGAKAVLVRSLTTDPDSPPHTGAVDYTKDAPKIPAAALSWRAADQLAKAVEQGKATVTLKLRSKDLGMVESGNVVAEIRGRELPDEVVVLGGHIDSWDVGHGAHDNGSGVVTAMAALNLLRRLGLQPRRTIRLVLWTEEESDETGAAAYAAAHGNERHVAALESDSGGAPVMMLSMQTKGMPMGPPGSAPPPPGLDTLREVASLLSDDGVRTALPFFAGTDLQPLVAQGVVGVGIWHDPSHYFDVHHSDADRFDRVDPEALQQGVAVFATVAYALADMKETLGGEAG